jgi:hypothetical protein
MKPSLAAILDAAGMALAIGTATLAASSPEERLQRAVAQCRAYGFAMYGEKTLTMAECIQREVHARWF